MELSAEEIRACLSEIWAACCNLTRCEGEEQLLAHGKQKLDTLRSVLQRMLHETGVVLSPSDRTAAGLDEASWYVLPIDLAPQVALAIETGSALKVNGDRYQVTDSALDHKPGLTPVFRAKMKLIPRNTAVEYNGRITTSK